MKIWSFSLAYNEPWIIRQSIDAYYNTHDPSVETVHVIVDAHWPVKYANTRAELESMCRDYKCILLDPGKNMGLANNFNWAWKQFAIPDNAGVVGYDLDCRPITKGWDRAMGELFMAQPDAAWISLMNPRGMAELLPCMHGEVRIGNHLAFKMKHPVVNSICMFRQGWLGKIGGISEYNPFYGSLEICLFPKLGNYFWYIMKDIHEGDGIRDQENTLYRLWKYNTCHAKTIPVDKDFGTWMRETHPEIL